MENELIINILVLPVIGLPVPVYNTDIHELHASSPGYVYLLLMWREDYILYPHMMMLIDQSKQYLKH